MDFRAIGLLQKAVPILLRHLDAYVELAERDWRTAKLNAAHSMRLLAIMVGSGFFALLLCCGVVAALTWDGPYRVTAMASMAALFAVAVTVSGILYAKREREVFPSVRKEWREDRELVQELLFGDADANESELHGDRVRPDSPMFGADFRPTRANGAASSASSNA